MCSGSRFCTSVVLGLVYQGLLKNTTARMAGILFLVVFVGCAARFLFSSDTCNQTLLGCLGKVCATNRETTRILGKAVAHKHNAKQKKAVSVASRLSITRCIPHARRSEHMKPGRRCSNPSLQPQTSPMHVSWKCDKSFLSPYLAIMFFILSWRMVSSATPASPAWRRLVNQVVAQDQHRHGSTQAVVCQAFRLMDNLDARPTNAELPENFGGSGLNV